MRHDLKLLFLLVILGAGVWGCAGGTGPDSVRVGAGVDLVAFERTEESTRFKFLDLRILRVFEYLDGAEGSGLGFMESPIFKLFAQRSDAKGSELRILDFRILAFFRSLREGHTKSELHVLRLPLLGSLYGYERDGDIESRTYLFLYNRQTTRPTKPDVSETPEESKS